MLNDTKLGFNIKNNRETLFKISHLLYMDDLKLYSANEIELNDLITITKQFSDDVGMEFGLDKCKVMHMKKGKISNIDFRLETEIDQMKEGEYYKYLGMLQSNRIDGKKMKQTVSDTFKNRMHSICKTQLNGKNKVKAINAFAMF
jgi:hypothetical protein